MNSDADSFEGAEVNVNPVAIAEASHVEPQSSAELLAAILSPTLVQATMDRFDQGMVCFSGDGKLICCNQRYKELLCLPAELLQSFPTRTDILDFLRNRGDFGQPSRFFDEVGKTLNLDPSSPAMPGRYWHRTQQGKVLEISAATLESGILIRTLADVTQYHVARRQAEKNAAKLQRILEAFNPGTWELDLNTGVVEINAAWAQIVGYGLDEITPLNREQWRSMVCEEDMVRNNVAAIAFLTGTARQFNSKFRMRHKDGSWVWVQCIGRNYDGVNDSGSIVISGTLVDITDKVIAQSQTTTSMTRLQAEVEQQNKMLERAVKDITLVSSSLAHDLRTPLRSINGFSSVLTEPDVSSNPSLVADYSKRIADQSAKMGRMVSSMLQLLRIMATPPVAQPIRISDVLKLAIDEVKSPGLQILLDFAKDPEIESDPSLLGVALSELVKNSIAYAKPDQPLSLQLRFSEAEKVYAIKDNGLGFDMAKANYLFKPFCQINNVGRNGGLGMGLALASKCIERLGGTLWASSAEGEGATFYFTLGPAIK